MFTAAEVSGDRLAGPVLRELARLRADLRWTGIGGPAMAASGVHDAFGRVDALGGAGLVELLPQLPAILGARRRLSRALEARPPVAVFVDAPDLHLPLARKARALGVPCALLVVPQFWAWRAGRVRAVAQAADLALCLFQHEVAPLRSLGVAAFWVGHPAAELPLAPTQPPRSPRLGLLPGSRRSEVRRYLGPFLDTAAALRCGDVEVAWRLPEPPPVVPGVRFSTDSGPSVLSRVDLALVAAGTASLEAAVLGVPVVVAAALHPASAVVARRLLRLRWLALPNVLLGREAVREVQQDLSLSTLTAALSPLLSDLDASRQRAHGTAAELRHALGPGDFALRSAERLLPLLDAA